MCCIAHRRLRQSLLKSLLPACVLLLIFVQPMLAAGGKDKPDNTIPLASLGYVAPPARFANNPAYTDVSMHYVDAHHLLFTYNARKLIHRTPDDTPDVPPQIVEALLLDMTTGQVMAQTDWRLHDHGQYLWPLGSGAFLLRNGHELRLLTPLAQKDPLHTRLLMNLPGNVQFIQTSPDGRLAMVESDVVTVHRDESPFTQPAPNAAPPTDGSPSPNAAPAPPPMTETHSTDIQYVEFDLSQAAQGIITAKRVGRDTADAPLVMPLLHDGFLKAKEAAPGDWDISYVPLRGTPQVLGDVVSTCQPRMAFLSNQEIYIFTCESSDSDGMSTMITLDRRELWQAVLDTDSKEMAVHPAAESGRFVTSRILNHQGPPSEDMMPGAEYTKQRIEVRDVASGMIVVSVDAQPVHRSAQNFALSDDGRQLAVLQNDTIALYDLAPLQSFPPKQIKPDDLVFVGAKDVAGPPAPARTVSVAVKPDSAPTAAVPPASIVDAPVNVDERRSKPTLLTPEEQQEREQKSGGQPPSQS